MNLNMKELFEEACTVSLGEIKQNIKATFTEFFKRKASAYFLDKHDVQRLKDNPAIARMRGVDPKDPDAGMVMRMIDDVLTDKILDDDMKQFMRRYMDENFGQHLKDALDKAMKHKAHAIAFKEIRKVQGPQRAVVVGHQILKFMEQQGAAVNSYRSAAETDYTWLRFPYKFEKKLIDSFKIAFPNCEVKIEERGTTTLKVYYDEHINAQA